MQAMAELLKATDDHKNLIILTENGVNGGAVTSKGFKNRQQKKKKIKMILFIMQGEL